MLDFLTKAVELSDISKTKQDILYKKHIKLAEKNGLDLSSIFAEKGLEYGTKLGEKFRSEEDYQKEVVELIKIALTPELYKIVYDNKIEEWLASDNECTDGKDDGKISFWSKVGNCIEGAAKTVVSTIHNIISDPKKLVTTVVTGVALAALMTTPVGAVLVPVLGAIVAGKLIYSGIKTIQEADQKAKNATTDAEAKDAWEDIGQGGTQVAAGGVVAYTSGSALWGVFKGGAGTVAAENAEAFEREGSLFWEVIKSIFDPGNIEATQG